MTLHWDRDELWGHTESHQNLCCGAPFVNMPALHMNSCWWARELWPFTGFEVSLNNVVTLISITGADPGGGGGLGPPLFLGTPKTSKRGKNVARECGAF